MHGGAIKHVGNDIDAMGVSGIQWQYDDDAPDDDLCC